ncbi:hypothetical protein [Caminibacter sp.]
MKQLSVFIEKKPGKLKEITEILKNGRISIKAVTLSEGSDFGILRVIVNDVIKAAEIIEKGGFSLRVVDVIAVYVDDEIGALNEIVSLLSDNGVNIEYCYTLNSEKKGAFVFKVDNLNKAKEILRKNSVVFE